jgi:hypothetical protein
LITAKLQIAPFDDSAAALERARLSRLGRSAQGHALACHGSNLIASSCIVLPQRRYRDGMLGRCTLYAIGIGMSQAHFGLVGAPNSNAL